MMALMMKKTCLPPLLLLLAAALSACSSGPPLDKAREEAEAANRAAAQALAATAPASDAKLGGWLSTERTRVEGERSATNQRYADAEKACWRSFAVNDCLREARWERRAVMDRLRLEDLALNDVERQRRTDARLRDLDKKQQEAVQKGNTLPSK